MITRTIVFAATIAVAACEQPLSPVAHARSFVPPAAQTDETIRQNQSIDLSGTVVSPCTGEPIVFQGAGHIVASIDLSATGAMLSYHLNTQGVSGVGLVSGTKYQIIQIAQEDENAILIPPSGSASVAVHYRVISDGNLANFLEDVVYTFTFPPLSATYTTQNLRCEG